MRERADGARREAPLPARGRGASRSRPEREAPPRGRDRGPAFQERLDGVLRDAGVYRCVAAADLVRDRFGGNRFAGARGLQRLEREGLVEVARAKGPKGGSFQVVSLTDAGLRRLENRAAEGLEPEGQRWWSGSVQLRQAAHDAAVARAGRSEAERIAAEGGSVRRVAVDSELKSLAARRVERARFAGGDRAAAEEAEAVAAELGLPVKDGKLAYPDARIHYVDADGEERVVDVEVATRHYRAKAVAAKAAAGFAVFAAGGSGLSRAFGSRSGGGSRGGRSGGGGRGGGSGGGGGRGDEEGLLKL